MKKLMLIQPATKHRSKGSHKSKVWGMPPLALAYVAAYTPGNWDIRVIDELIEEIPFGDNPDLVGISISFTTSAPRAYQISDEFRKKGIPTILGGIHVSMMQDEALNYADTIVIGEAESVWKRVISDFEEGRLEKKYFGQRLSLENLPLPRRDLLSDKYELDIIQTTRGCPFNCEFCCVTAFNGSTYRQRPVEEVLNEISHVKTNVFHIIDDNILGVGKEAETRAISLFKGMIDRKFNKYWSAMASINIANNEDVLIYAYKSGCRNLFIGFETINPDSLKEMKKGVNIKFGVSGFKAAIKKIQRHGISINGGIIIGNDNDGPMLFRELNEFLKAADNYAINILTPLPGTRLFERLEKEDRIIYNSFPADWQRYTNDQIIIKPKSMSIDELAWGYRYLVNKRFSRKAVFLQGLKTLIRTKNPRSAFYSYLTNKRSWKDLVYSQNFDNFDRQK